MKTLCDHVYLNEYRTFGEVVERVPEFIDCTRRAATCRQCN